MHLQKRTIVVRLSEPTLRRRYSLQEVAGNTRGRESRSGHRCFDAFGWLQNFSAVLIGLQSGMNEICFGFSVDAKSYRVFSTSVKMCGWWNHANTLSVNRKSHAANPKRFEIKFRSLVRSERLHIRQHNQLYHHYYNVYTMHSYKRLYIHIIVFAATTCKSWCRFINLNTHTSILITNEKSRHTKSVR